MKAVIYTKDKHKCDLLDKYTMPLSTISILGKSLLESNLDLLESYNADQIILVSSPDPAYMYCVKHRMSSISAIDYQSECHTPDGSMTDNRSGSAGRIKAMHDSYEIAGETFVALCDSAYTNANIEDTVRAHKKSGALASCIVTAVPSLAGAGSRPLVIDANNRIVDISEDRGGTGGSYSSGIFVMEPAVFDSIESDKTYDIEEELFCALVREGKDVRAIHTPMRFARLEDLSDFFKMTMASLSGKITWQMPGRRIAEGIYTGANVSFDPARCHVRPPVFVDSGTYVAPGSVITGPVAIGRNCYVEVGALIDTSVILDYSRVVSGANIAQAVAGPSCYQDSYGNILEPKAAGVVASLQGMHNRMINAPSVDSLISESLKRERKAA